MHALGGVHGSWRRQNNVVCMTVDITCVIPECRVKIYQNFKRKEREGEWNDDGTHK
jgi:hypothetical protein